MDLKLEVDRQDRQRQNNAIRLSGWFERLYHVEIMTSKIKARTPSLNLAFFYLFGTLSSSGLTLAKGNEVALPSFTDFSQMVK